MNRGLFAFAVAGILSLSSLAPPLCAQDPIRGPMLGWVWDARQESLRPVLGIAGSSVLGKAPDLGFAVRFAIISGNQEYAFVLASDTRDPILVDLRPLTPAARLLEGIASGAERAALSPRGTTAVLWYPELKKLAVVGGLPAGATLLREIDLSVEGAPGSIAVNDDGALVLAAYSESNAVMVFDVDGNRWKLQKEAKVASLAFADGNRDALLGAEDGVFIARDVSANSVIEQVAAVASAGALASDGRRLLVVDNSSQSVIEVNLDTRDTRSAQCPCAPTGLVRMSNSGIFRLNEVSDGPLWLLEISESGLRTVFVPPDPDSTLDQ